MSSGEFLGPMEEMRIKLKHLGIVAQPRTLRNLVLKFLSIQNTSENHETWYGCHVMVLPCCGKKIGRIGTDFGISFLQIEASLKKACGSERERATFECETIYVVPLEFIYKGNIELHECPVKFWNYSVFVWPYLHIN